MVKLYSKKGCGPCNMVKSFFKYKGINYVEFDRESDAFQKLTEKYGHIATVPIVEVDDQIIVGYNPSQLSKLA